jgi:glutathione S-transferase
MTLQVFGHPFSSFFQKVAVALYEKSVPFELRMLDPHHPDNAAEFAKLSPLGKFPLLVDGALTIAETSIIIEHIDRRWPGETRLIPTDPDLAMEVRYLDRFFDLYLNMQMQRVVGNALRKPGERDPLGVVEARSVLVRAYRWLDQRLGGRAWAAGDDFSLADCAAAPALFYADWVEPIDPLLSTLKAYRTRLNERPSMARAIDEGRPYRPLFPLGAPDRD